MNTKMKGLDELRARVPEVATTWGLLRIVLALLGVVLLTSLFFLAADRWFPEWMPDGEIVVFALGLLLLSRFFSQRERFQHKYGPRAFQAAFIRFNLWGLGIIGASIGHLAYISGPELPNLWWKPWLQALGYVLLIGGVLLALRVLASTGIDTLMMLYVYQPPQGTQLASGLYSMLRHPLYSAAIHIGFGLALIHANWYALLVAVLLPLFVFGWVRLVEEPELLQRFPGYADYRRRVPALAPRPRDLPGLWNLLIFGTAPDR